jgi:heme/copper-type cytochrome/quinol oxidase subunit 3
MAMVKHVPGAAAAPAVRKGYTAVLPTGSALGPPPPPTEVPKGTNLLGVLLVCVADGMLLLAFLTAWWTIKAGSPAWPPGDVSVGTYIPSVVTITAVMSSFGMHWVVSSIRRNDQRSAGAALVFTALFGIAVANAQWYTMARENLTMESSAYATLFNLLTGYHLVHQVIALGALVLVGARVLAGHFGRRSYDPIRAVAAFWHYTVIVWGVIMTALYLFSAHA